jgi:hypothetical protein
MNDRFVDNMAVRLHNATNRVNLSIVRSLFVGLWYYDQVYIVDCRQAMYRKFIDEGPRVADYSEKL